MYFNVSGLLCGGVGGQHRFHFADVSLDHDGTLFREIEARGVLTRTDRTVLVEADVRAICDIECARCLAESETTVEVEFAEEFVPSNMDLVARRARAGIDDDGDGLSIDESNVLDLTIPLWQTLWASLPLAQLCSPDCKGICADCYGDMNGEGCRCDTIDVSARHAAT